jgi:hypothetical protein
MKFRVSDEVENEQFEIVDAQVVEAQDRRFILRFVALAFVAFLVASAGYEIWASGREADFHTVSAIWRSCQGLVGVMIGYYFGKGQK